MDIGEIRKILRSKYNAEFIGVITHNNHNYIQSESNNAKVYYEILNGEIIHIQDEQIIESLKSIYESKNDGIIY